MGRRKVRNYNLREYYKTLFDDYFRQNMPRVIEETCKRLGFDSFDDLHSAEMHMRFGLDCGWIRIYPTNDAQRREWRLDGCCGDDGMTIHPVGYNPQSVTVKNEMVEIMLRDLGLRDDFYVSERLD